LAKNVKNTTSEGRNAGCGKNHRKIQPSVGLMYTIEIFYSEEDEGFIVVVPELPGCSAFGKTEERALKEVRLPCSSG
jgi:hypothetical protein